MQYDPKNFWNPENDRFILSKGHAAPLLYSAWKEVGVITEEELMTLRTFNSTLEGHPTPRFPYVDVATGSLGQGLSIGLGESLTARLDKLNFYSYVLMGDSESAEGSVWEAAEIAAFYNCHNLIAIIDVNNLGQSTQTMDNYDLDKYSAKFTAFGWKTFIVDGHNMHELVNALNKAREYTQKPVMIIAKTIKGYGINADIEGKNGYHGKAFSKEQLPELLENLKNKFPKASSYNIKEKKLNNSIAQSKNHTNKMKEKILCKNFTIPKTIPYKTDEKLATRQAYGDALAAIGQECEDIVSLDAEVKNSTFAETFEKQFPHRFFQCFVAEQNMVSMGVGFAARAKIPFISTFAAFLSRAHDQLRMAAIGRSPLRIVGSHAGVSIGEDGPSQMGLEDIASMRSLPDSVVLYPSDAVSAFKLVYLMAGYHEGISYLRTTRGKTPVLYNAEMTFQIGKCNIIKESEQDVACIIAAGITLFEALKAYELLAQKNIYIRVIDCYSIKPLPTEQIRASALASDKKIISVEDHYREGGLGEAVCYELRNDNFAIECLALTKLPRSGKPQELLAFEKIDYAAIIESVKGVMK